MKNKWIYTAVVVISLIPFSYKLINQDYRKCFCNSGYGIDAIEYHFLASNFALFFKFPVLGFIGDPKEYNLCEENIAAKEYFSTLEKLGPVTFTGRPPMYPLILGALYAIFGMSPTIMYALNFISIFMTGVLLFFLIRILTKSWIIALTSGILYYFLYEQKAWVDDAEAFSRFSFTLCLVSLIWAIIKQKSFLFLIAGLLISFALLTKGTITIFIIIVSGYFLYNFFIKKNVTHLKNVFTICIGILMLLVPWMTFINMTANKTISERFAWYEKMIKTVPAIKVASVDELIDPLTKWYKKDAVDFGMKMHQLRYICDSNFIVVTNQVNSAILLSDHNEFCIDGDYHPEYEVITTSYHNNFNINDNVWSRIISFYKAYPKLGLNILYAKIANGNTKKPRLFMLMGYFIGIWSVIMIFGKFINSALRKKIFFFLLTLTTLLCTIITFKDLWYYQWLIILAFTPFSILGLIMKPKISIESTLSLLFFSFIFLFLVIYGDARFIATLDSIWLLGCIYFPYLIWDQLHSLQHPNRINSSTDGIFKQ